MVVPAQPVAGAPVDVAWGQIAHQQVVANHFQGGEVIVSNGSAGPYYATNVTFPVPFGGTPVVFVQLLSLDNGWYVELYGPPNPTATGFAILMVKRDGAGAVSGAKTVQWLAFGPRA